MLITLTRNSVHAHIPNSVKPENKKTNLKMQLKINCVKTCGVFVYPSLLEPVCGSLWVYLCVTVLISKSRSGLGHSLPLVARLCTYSDDVNKVVFSQCVQDGVDGVLGYGQPEPLHAAADIHHDHHIFRRRGRLDIPEKRRIKFRTGSDISSTLLDIIYQQSSRQTRAGRVQALSFYLFLRSSIHASPHLLIIIL